MIHCAVCNGPIYDVRLFKSPHSEPRWVHLHDEDWRGDVHQALPLTRQEA